MATLRRTGIILALLALFTLVVPAFAQTALGTVTADQLNVRTLPDPIDGVAFTRVFRGQAYTVVGRDSTANWFQIQLPDGNTGWVSSAYFRVDNFGGVPITNADYVQGRVLSHLLNLREAPTTNARVLGQISRGQVYRVVGKNADASWYQLRLPTGLTAWVISRSLFVSDPSRIPVVNPGTSSPTTSGGTTGPITGIVTASQLNVRTLPDPLDGVAFTRVFNGQTYNVIGRDDTTTWFQIQLSDGNTGWVSSAYLRVSNPGALPVTFGGNVQGTVINASLLNVRSTPNPYVSNNILGQISRGQTYRVLARSSNNWYEIRLPSGVTGWVNGRYLSVTNPGAVPLR